MIKRRFIKMIGLFCVSALVFTSGCTDQAESESERTEATVIVISTGEHQEEDTVRETETEAAPAGTEESDSSSDEQEGVWLDAETLTEYQKMFDVEHSWYSQALTSIYTSAEEMDLGMFFYNGIPDVDNTLSEAEQEFLGQDSGWAEYGQYLDTSRLPAERMDEILQEYFGISLEQADRRGLENFLYFEETDCYYLYRGDSNVIRPLIYDGYERADGTVALYYGADALTSIEEEYVVVLRPADVGSGGRTQVVSNVRAE